MIVPTDFHKLRHLFYFHCKSSEIRSHNELENILCLQMAKQLLWIEFLCRSSLDPRLNAAIEWEKWRKAKIWCMDNLRCFENSMFIWPTQVDLCCASLNFCFGIWWYRLVVPLWISTYRRKWSNLYPFELSKPSWSIVLVHFLLLGLFHPGTLQGNFDDPRLWVIHVFTFMEIDSPYFAPLDPLYHGNDFFLLMYLRFWWLLFSDEFVSSLLLKV